MTAFSTTFKKIGSESGYKNNSILTTDEDKNLELIDARFIDFQSGVEVVLNEEVYKIQDRKQMRIKGMLTIETGGRIVLGNRSRLVLEF